jgi:hypothetical protein
MTPSFFAPAELSCPPRSSTILSESGHLSSLFNEKKPKLLQTTPFAAIAHLKFHFGTSRWGGTWKLPRGGGRNKRRLLAIIFLDLLTLFCFNVGV